MDANCATDDCGVEVALRGAVDGDALLSSAGAARRSGRKDPGQAGHTPAAHRARWRGSWRRAGACRRRGGRLRELAPLMQALAEDDQLLPPAVVTEA